MFNKFHLEGVDVFNNNDYQNATILFIKAIEKNPEEIESYFFLGRCFLFCDEQNKAIDVLKFYIELSHDSSNANISCAYDLLGQCHAAQSNDDAALQCYIRATKIDPECASAWHNLGLLYTKLANDYLEQDINESMLHLEKARIFLDAALEICSDNPLFLHSLASWHEKHVQALENIPEATAFIEKNIDDDLELAIEYYRKATAACPKNEIKLMQMIDSSLTECLAKYGHNFYKKKDYPNALTYYLQTIKLDPNHLVAINQIGMSFLKQQRFSEARDYFASILNITVCPHERGDAWLNIASTYRLERSWENAKTALIASRGLDPDSPFLALEEKELISARSQISLITASQTIFSSSKKLVPQKPANQENKGQCP